jgi:CO/xanthine dehydrogenase FAD-binding subunit
MRLLLPSSLDEAVQMLAASPDLTPMAGGTDLLVHWPEQIGRHGRGYLDLSGLDELREMRWTNEHLELGALTTYWETLSDPRVGAELPLLHEAARQIGAIQIQARGTWAGNIANASPAADGVAVLMAYDASVELASSQGHRQVALAAFYHGYKQIEARDDELIHRILVPRHAYDFVSFEKVAPRQAQAITVTGVAVAHGDAGWRVVAVSMAPTVCRCPAIEAILEDEAEVRSPEDLLAAIRADVSPIDDIRSTARYREHVMSRVLYYALRDHCPGVS